MAALSFSASVAGTTVRASRVAPRAAARGAAVVSASANRQLW
jgi:hypothetical protein